MEDKKSTVKKQTFLGGAAVLALGTAVVKVIGMLFKIPLNRIIGEAGFGYFTTAYDIYSLLLIISTAGLPVAMSRMISEARALGRTKQVTRIYQTAYAVFLGLGIAGTAGMLFFCKGLAEWMEQPNSWFAILCLSPALFFIGIISAQRGFFQGQSSMTPTSVSQIFEALCKLIIGLAAAFIVMKLTKSYVYAAGSAILGITVGTVVSALYLSLKRRKAVKELDEICTDETVLPFGKTAKSLLAIAVPITLGAACLQLISLIDAKLVMHRLNDTGFAIQAEGLADGTSVADVLKGIYNYTQTIFNLPCAFIAPLTISAIPAITEALTNGNKNGVRKTSESSVRVMGLIALPCTFGLIALAKPIVAVLGHYSGEDLITATRLMMILGVVVVFNSYVLMTNAIMQAHRHVVLPVINMIAGGVVKIIVNWFLVGTPSVNIVGAPVGTLACYLVISALNTVSMVCVLKEDRPRIFRNLRKTAVASALMGGAAFGVLKACEAAGLRMLWTLVLCMAAAVVVYVVSVLLLRVITKEDCELLPKGDKIAKFLKIH